MGRPNGDKIIDNDDLQVLGYATPDIFGGFGNTISYKGWELYVFMDPKLGTIFTTATAPE